MIKVEGFFNFVCLDFLKTNIAIFLFVLKKKNCQFLAMSHNLSQWVDLLGAQNPRIVEVHAGWWRTVERAFSGVIHLIGVVLEGVFI